MTQSILDGTVCMSFIWNIGCTKEIAHSIQALKRPISKKNGTPWLILYRVQDDLLIAVNIIFMRVPFQYGFLFERWRSPVQRMLQKKQKP